MIFFAAGNGNESVEFDGYASYNKVIAVAACNDRGKRSVYSDFGKAVWCAFPSSDFGHADFDHPDPLTDGIWTTDRLGQRGYNPGDPQFGDAAGKYTNSFGGTSSSCPGAAGVAALVLSANAGKKCNGRWTVRVEDKAAQDSGTLIQIGLHLFLAPTVPSGGAVTPHAAPIPRRGTSRKKTPTGHSAKKTKR